MDRTTYHAATEFEYHSPYRRENGSNAFRGLFTSFDPAEQMGEVARDAHVEVFGDPGDRDGGLVAQSLSDFDFDRIAFRGWSGGCLWSSGFRAGGF